MNTDNIKSDGFSLIPAEQNLPVNLEQADPVSHLQSLLNSDPIQAKLLLQELTQLGKQHDENQRYLHRDNLICEMLFPARWKTCPLVHEDTARQLTRRMLAKAGRRGANPKDFEDEVFEHLSFKATEDAADQKLFTVQRTRCLGTRTYHFRVEYIVTPEDELEKASEEAAEQERKQQDWSEECERRRIEKYGNIPKEESDAIFKAEMEKRGDEYLTAKIEQATQELTKLLNTPYDMAEPTESRNNRTKRIATLEKWLKKPFLPFS